MKSTKFKTKQEKGITLMALIITIVVLLVLATVAINSVLNDGIISKAQDVANKFNEAQANEQNMIAEYLNYLNGGNDSNGNELTEEDLAEIDLVERYVLGPNKTGRSALEIANVDMSTMTVTSFKDDSNSITDASTTVTNVGQVYDETGTKGIVYAKYGNNIYKIVVDMATFMTESVENYSLDLVERYILGSNKTGRSTDEIIIMRNGVVSFIDDWNSIADASTTVTFIAAVFNSDQTKMYVYFSYENIFCVEVSYVAVIDVATSTTESVAIYNSTKPGLIFEGSLILDPGSINSDSVLFSYNRSYRLDVTIDGQSQTVYVDYFYGEYRIVMDTNGIQCMGIFNAVKDSCIVVTGECVINAIYDNGAFDGIVTENGFTAVREAENVWSLIKTPNGSYTVPDTIGGKTISRVDMSGIGGYATFNKPFELYSSTEGYTGYYLDGATFTTSDLNFFFDEEDGLLGILRESSCEYIDFSQCGDDITFSEDILEEIAYTNITIYVSTAVKAKYPDATNIVAKVAN